MELFKKIPMEHEGQAYEIRVLYETGLINVLAFRGNRPANGYRFQVQIPKKCDPQQVFNQNPVTDLVEACKKQIENRPWETLSQVFSECE